MDLCQPGELSVVAGGGRVSVPSLLSGAWMRISVIADHICGRQKLGRAAGMTSDKVVLTGQNDTCT